MKERSVLRKIIFVFFAVTIFPIIVIFAFFYPRNYTIMNQVVEDEITTTSQRVVEDLDEEILQMLGTGIELKNSIRNTTFDEKNLTRYNERIKTLLKSALNRCNLAETILYQSARGQVYSPSGTISTEYFQDILYSFSETGEKKERLEFDSKAPSLFYCHHFVYNVYNSTASPMLVLTYPLSDKNGCIIFLIPQSKVQTMFTELCGHHRDYLLYDSKTVYLSSASTLTEEEMWNTVQKQMAGVEDDTYIACKVDSKFFDLSYQIFEKGELLYHDLNRFQRITVAIVILIVVSGIATLLIFLRVNYRPLLNALRRLEKTPGFPEKEKQGSEYDRLQSGIAYMQDSNSKLNSTLRTYREKYKSFFLYEFLSGGIQKINDLADVEERLEIEVYQRLLIPVFLELRGEKGTDKSVCLSLVDEMNSYFRNAQSTEIQVIFSVCIEKSAVFCLASMEKTSGIPVLNDLEAFLRREVFCLSAMKKIGPFCAVAGKISENIYEAEENIQLLYRTLDSALLQGLPDYSVTDVEQLYDSEVPGLLHPVGRIYELTRAVESRDIERIHGAVENIIQVLASASTSIAVAKLLFGQAMFVFRAANPSFVSRTGSQTDSAELYSPSQMTEMLLEQEKGIYLLFEQEIETVSNHARDVVAYVDEHFLDFNFSIAAVAEHYHMQISNMSAYFKKCYGVNFQQYVSQKKVERAKELLEDPELTLEDISQQLGYSNASSFSRTFKRIVGITPGTYRGKE